MTTHVGAGLQQLAEEAAQAPQESYASRMAREAEERGDVAKAAYWLRLKAVVDQAPPLTASQRDRLRILLTPTPSAPARSA